MYMFYHTPAPLAVSLGARQAWRASKRKPKDIL